MPNNPRLYVSALCALTRLVASRKNANAPTENRRGVVWATNPCDSGIALAACRQDTIDGIYRKPPVHRLYPALPNRCVVSIAPEGKVVPKTASRGARAVRKQTRSEVKLPASARSDLVCSQPARRTVIDTALQQSAMVAG